MSHAGPFEGLRVAARMLRDPSWQPGRGPLPPPDPAWAGVRRLHAVGPTAEGLAAEMATAGEPGTAARLGADPDRVAVAARAAELVLRTRARAEALGFDALTTSLAPAVARETAVSMALEASEARIRDALFHADVRRVALLKGSATAYVLFTKAEHRQRRDVDLLVDEADAMRAARALEDVGFRPRSPTGPRSRTIPLVWRTPQGLVECDLHRRLAPDGWPALSAPGVLDRAVDADEHDAPLKTACLEDLLLHTCLHAAWNGFTVPLKSWLDVAGLLAHPDLDRRAVLRRAPAYGARTALWAGVAIARRWLGAPPLAGLEELAPTPPVSEALSWVLAGHGAAPLRGPVDKRTALALTAPLVLPGTQARSRWLIDKLRH